MPETDVLSGHRGCTGLYVFPRSQAGRGVNHPFIEKLLIICIVICNIIVKKVKKIYKFQFFCCRSSNLSLYLNRLLVIKFNWRTLQ